MFKISKFQENNILIYSLILLVVLLGLTFRFYNLGYENLWFDEIFSYWVTDPNLSFNETFSRVKSTESIPFLYYYLVKVCNLVFGYDPIVGRIFSAFFGFLSIFTVSKLCKKFADNKSYLFALCLTSLNIYLIIYSQEMRVYIFTFFLTSIALIFFFNLFEEKKSQTFSKNFFLFSLFMFLAILSHPFCIIILGSLICFTFINYFFLNINNKKVNISLTVTSIFTLLFLFHYLGYVSTDKVSWIEQPDLKFFTNFYFSKFFGSRLMGIIHLIMLIFLTLCLLENIIKNKKIIFLYIMLFLSYFIPLIYGYIFEPIILHKYIIFVLIPIILIISILVFEIKNKILRNFFIIFLIFLNLGNHLAESTLKQFFYKRVNFNADFYAAFEFIQNSGTKKMVLYRKNNNQNQDFYGLALLNYVQFILKSKNYKIDLLNNDDLKNYKGKIWSICYIECYRPPLNTKILNENFLHGGLKLSFWENK